MERKMIWLIVGATLLMGLLLWSRRDARKPTPRFSPTVDIQSACEAQKEHWCALAVPDGASQQDWYHCRTEFTPRCISCLVEIEHARKHGVERDARSSGCAGLAGWRHKYGGRSTAAAPP